MKWLILILVTLTAACAPALPEPCEPEVIVAEPLLPVCGTQYEPMGPFCVHEFWAQAGPLKHPFTEVYDTNGDLLWKDQGSIIEVTDEFLLIDRLTLVDGRLQNQAMKCPWVGFKYSTDCEAQ